MCRSDPLRRSARCRSSNLPVSCRCACLAKTGPSRVLVVPKQQAIRDENRQTMRGVMFGLPSTVLVGDTARDPAAALEVDPTTAALGEGHELQRSDQEP